MICLDNREDILRSSPACSSCKERPSEAAAVKASFVRALSRIESIQTRESMRLCTHTHGYLSSALITSHAVVPALILPKVVSFCICWAFTSSFSCSSSRFLCSCHDETTFLHLLSNPLRMRISKLVRSRFGSNTKRGVCDGLLETSLPEIRTSKGHGVLQQIMEGQSPQFPYWFTVRLFWDVFRAQDSLAHVPDDHLGLETLHVESVGARWGEDADFGHARVG